MEIRKTTLFCLGQVAARCRQLWDTAAAGDFVNYSGAEQGEENAKRTIREIEENLKKTRPPKNPNQLFDAAGREGDFLQDKIDFLGKGFFSAH